MKIDKTGVAMASIYMLAITSLIAAGDSRLQTRIDDYKSQILENDSDRYKMAVKSESGKPTMVRADIWEKAYEEMQDSMKKAGVAQKNYFEGSQMVSDSLKIK